MKKQLLPCSFLLLLSALGSKSAMADTSPIIPTTLVNNQIPQDAAFYTLTIRGKYAAASPSKTASEMKLLTSLSFPMPDSLLFVFTGNETDGYIIYNKAIGTSKPYYSANTNNGNTPTFVKSAGTPFLLSTNGTGYSMYAKGNTTACLNDFSNASIVKYWTNSSSPTDAGSRTIFSRFISSDGAIETNATALFFKFVTFENKSNPSSPTSLPIDNLKLTFSGDNCIANSDKGVKTFSLSNLNRWFANISETIVTGIDNGCIKDECSPISALNSIKIGDRVSIFDLNGHKLYSYVAQTTGKIIQLKQLGKGTYIVRINQQNYKIYIP